MPSNAKSIVSEYWPAFEKLAAQMISTEFKIEPDLIYLTRPSKDGGFDAIMVHNIAQTGIFDIYNTTVLEAKLRSAKKSVGFRAFAATLVIAYNYAAQTLIVVSNRTFSKQALQQVSIFEWKTNTRIKLIDGPTLSGWIRRHYKHLFKEYPKQLLDFLIQEFPKKESYRCIEIPVPNLNDLQVTLGLTESAKSGKIELGWISENQIAPCELILNKEASRVTENNYFAKRYPLIGRRRKENAKRLFRTLKGKAGIAVLHGTAGVGKSVLLHHVLQELEANDVPIASIDLGPTTTSRQLFLRILTALSGVDPTIVLSNEGEKIDYRPLISYAGGKPVTKQMQDAVLTVLYETAEKYHHQQDLNEQLLLDFLENVIKPYGKRRRSILVFQELNRTSPETLEFLSVVSNRLSKAGIGVLIELRDSGDATIIPSKQWDTFIRLFLNISTIGNFLVEPLSTDEADEYLEELLPGIGPHRSEIIRKRVGRVPLFLYSTAVWLREEGIISRESSAGVVEDLERFFEGISPENCTAILDRLILTWRGRTDFPYADCLSAAVLLDGKLGHQELSIIAPEINPISLTEALQHSGLFSVKLSKPTELEVLHDLLFERMNIFEDKHPSRKAHIAELLLPHLNQLILDPFSRNLKSVNLLSAMGDWNEVYPLAIESGKHLAKTRQWVQSSRYLEIAHTAAQNLYDERERSIANVHSLVELLEVESLRYRIGQEENLNRLDSLNTQLRFTSNIEKKDELCLRTLLLEWRAYHVREDFLKALEIASKARELTLQISDNVDIELCGKAFSNLGITLKALDRRKESLAVFEEGIQRFPNSITLKAEKLSNIAAFALRDNPDLALQCYQELLHEVEGTGYSFLEIIHAHVDLAMANFLRGDYDASMKDAARGQLLAVSNGVPAEEARAWNIIGCCHWVKDNIEDADRAFDLATFASERTMSRRFLWRMRTNRAGTALELNNENVAYSNAKSAEELITGPRRENFKMIANDKNYITSRWYAALLAIALYYHILGKSKELESLIQKVELPLFRQHAERILRGEYPEDVFAQTTHLQVNRIMITG